jgi:translation initiation factor IF-3
VNEVLVNELIKAREVRLVGTDGEQLGIVSISDARNQANDAGLDLVCVSPAAQPPVCKILDYGKYRFDLQKKEKEIRKKQRESAVEVKELQLRPNIDSHDLDIKTKHAREFLQEGDKVKFVLKFRGREASHNALGFEVVEQVRERLADISVVEVQPNQNGKTILMVLAPAK